MRVVTAEDVRQALATLGVGRGDVLYVHSQLFTLGLTGASKQDVCQTVYECFRAVIGPEGTLVVPTFTTTVARRGGVFERDATECDTGIFSEYVRQLPGTQRSLHPINSVAAHGPAASRLTQNVSATNYGIDTPFDRMLQLDAKAINLGFRNRFSNSWHHYVEAMMALPYLYNKLIDVEVRVAGQPVPGPFFATLRYLDFDIANDLTRFDAHLIDTGNLRRQKIGSTYVSCIAARRYVELLIEELKRDPYYLLKAPPRFRAGERPWDGPPQADGIRPQ